MKLMPCPVNGLRNISEFQYLGPVRATRGGDPATLIAHLFFVENAAGVMAEWWRHTPSNTIFVAERDTLTDTIVTTRLPDQTDQEAT